ncbi:MAG TPA: hypothetical protein VNG51_09135 [Ktedonobacteraceae bacterium]|nr:hypothetical protein [Ktedonobacteraceae bacterium]
MNKTQYVFSVIKKSYRRSLSPTKGDKRFLLVLYCFAGLYALLAFTFLFTSRILFAWLMYAAIGLGCAVGIAGLIWRFRDVARQVKEGEQPIRREEIPHTKLRKRVLWPLGLIILTFIPALFLPYNGLKIFLLILANLSWVWAIQRVWSYQSSTEREQGIQLTKLKRGFILLFAGGACLNLYMIIFLLAGVHLFSMLYLLFLPEAGLLAAYTGLNFLIQGNKLKPESS